MRDELRSDDRAGSVLVMGLIVSVATEMDEAKEVMFERFSGGMPDMELRKSPGGTAGSKAWGGPIRPGGRPRFSTTRLSAISYNSNQDATTQHVSRLKLVVAIGWLVTKVTKTKSDRVKSGGL